MNITSFFVLSILLNEWNLKIYVKNLSKIYAKRHILLVHNKFINFPPPNSLGMVGLPGYFRKKKMLFIIFYGLQEM